MLWVSLVDKLYGHVPYILGLFASYITVVVGLFSGG